MIDLNVKHESIKILLKTQEKNLQNIVEIKGY